jgi:heat shock protein HtpX
MMEPSFRHSATNMAQSGLLIGSMAVIAWVVLSALAGTAWALAIALGAVAGMLLGPSLPKSVLLSAYGAKRLSGRDFPEGMAILGELAARAGLPRIPVLCYVPSRLPNAFAMGTREDSVICVSDGLLRLLNRREFAAVLAHELCHIANRDLWIMGLADTMSRAVSLASWIGQFLVLLNLPLLFAGIAPFPWHVALLLVFSPSIMALMQLALSRTREFDADRGAAELTGDPEGLIAALAKLERRTGRFWEDMFLPSRRIPEPSLLRTHPKTEDRIDRLRELSRGSRHWRQPEDHFRRSPTGHAPAPRFGRLGLYR